MKILVTTEKHVRFTVPGFYSSGPEFQTFGEAVAAAREKAKGKYREFVALRICYAYATDSYPPEATDQEVMRWEVFPDRVVLVPKDQGGLCDCQAKAAMEFRLP